MKRAVGFQCAVEQRCVLLALRPVVQKRIHPAQHGVDLPGRIAAEQERALEEASQQRGTDALPAHVGHHHGPAIGTGGRDIEVVAAHLVRGDARTGDAEPARSGEILRKQVLLNLAGDLQFLLHAQLNLLFLEKAGVLDDGGGFERERLEKLAIATREIGDADLGVEVNETNGLVQRRMDGFRGNLGPHPDERHAHHASEFEVGDRDVRIGSALGAGIEVHREQLAPLVQGAMNEAGGDLEIVLGELLALGIARDLDLQVVAGLQHEEAALRASDRQRRVDDGAEHLVHR